MFFNIKTGKQVTKGSSDIIWLDDNWMHFSSAGGTSSIAMPLVIIKEFIIFLESCKSGRTDLKATNNLRFVAENHDSFDEITTVNIGIGGDNFISLFNFNVDKIDSFIEFLKTKL
jgi:hypothetical protein